MKTEGKDELFLRGLEKAADILSRRDCSELELREKLAAFFEPEMVEAVAVHAREKRWLLPPLELAELAAQKWTRAGKSAEYIHAQLRRRGLPEIVLESEDELEKMKTLLRKKFKSWDEAQNSWSSEERAKAYRFLKYRGFEDDLIRKVIHEEP